MAKIAYLLMCHRDPDAVIAQVRLLTGGGDMVAVHYDARAPKAEYEAIQKAFEADARVVFPNRRLRCGWGQWSLVAATLELVRVALAAFPEASHFHLLSGDCAPIKSAAHIRAALDPGDRDHIEVEDFFASDWIRTGFKEERLVYRHPFNERERRGLFYASYEIQRRLGLRRGLPRGLEMRIGSQWWCLRRATLEALLRFIAGRRDVVRFFRTTWIPDEIFFQTLVAHLVPAQEITGRPPTFLIFSDYGLPVVFHDDQYDMLAAQPQFFARKISPEAVALKERLAGLYRSGEIAAETEETGAALYAYLAGQGRVGRRFAPRMWEAEESIGANREILLVATKKWHVAKRLLSAIGAETNLASAGFLFDELAADLPDLGGIETTLEKRGRHRRALVRMICEAWETDRLILGLDLARVDHVTDFYGDRCQTRLLEVDCALGDGFLADHARRVGLAGPGAGALDALLPALRADIRFEAERLRAAGLPGHHRLSESAPLDANAAALAGFLSIGEDAALRIAQTPDLFAD